MQLQRVFWLAAAALVVATATPAMAQNLGGNLDAGIDVQRFEGVTSPYGVFSVDSARSAHHLQLSGGVLVNYSKDPLIFHASNGDKFPIVTQQVAAELLFGLGLFDFMEVGVALPIYLSNDASVGAEDLSGATVGDLRLRPKLTLLDQDETGFGLAVLAYITTPTGDDAAFASNGQFSVRPGLAATTGTDKLEIMLNLSADVQGERQFGDLQLGSELLFGLGAQYELVNGLLLGTEVYGSTDFGQFFEEQETPVEGLIGLKYRLAGGLNFELAAGRGITRGYGAPAARVIGGIRYAEYNDDLDGDGILNRDDACKHDAEDVDLFEDEDGCPDPDNDGDGVPDKSDDCPNRAEDPDGFQDADGCPDPDNDSDGVPDAEDECPDIAGLAELAGCPKPDQDDDGVLDKDDKCPDVPEDADGFEDEDGCPDPDNDGDGFLDVDDKCPDEAEDKDGFEDEDGCPDPDNDSDGVPDAQDKCPKEKETINGFEDDDGCPDKGKGQVVVTTDELRILQKVFFDTGKSTIKRKSFKLLNQVALTLKANPGIKLVEVQGHTDDVGEADYNRELSDSRAASVKRFLEQAGIAPERLRAKGYGEDSPAVAIDGLKGGKLRRARAKNRRVQFLIVEDK